MHDEHQPDDVEMVPDEENASRDIGPKIKKLREELEKTEAEKREYLDGWQRAKADLINYKKDEAKRFEDLSKFAAEALIAETVQVLDNFDLALRHDMPKDVEKGVILIRSQLEDILRRRGLEIVQSLGKPFDPAFHESMGEVRSDTSEGTVVEELQKGYLLNGKVLRPARVKISGKSAPAAS